MSDVVDLDERRAAAAGPGYAECTCGSGWFELRRPDGEPAAFSLSPEGSVTGYAGIPHCVECGRAYAPPGGPVAGY